MKEMLFMKRWVDFCLCVCTIELVHLVIDTNRISGQKKTTMI